MRIFGINEICSTLVKHNTTNIKKYLYLIKEKSLINLSIMDMPRSKPNKIKTVRPETLEFIILYNQLRGKAFSGNAQLAEVLGFNSPSSITEIIKSRQNIDPEKFRMFKEKYSNFLDGKKNTAYSENSTTSKQSEGIPMVK